MAKSNDERPCPSVRNASRTAVWKPGDAYPPEALEARLLLERDGVLAVDKPAGLPTSGRNLDDPDCLQFALMRRYGQMVWAVHQLDADTSGINLFVMEKALVPIWQRRLQFPNARKLYLAIVEGIVSFQEKRIELPIGPVDPGGLGVTACGKHAVTHVGVRGHGRDCSLVEVMIETGRTHQIRIHLAHLGHPLVGEDWYAPNRPRRHDRQALHAWKLGVAEAQEPTSLVCPRPPDFVDLAERLGLAAALAEATR